MEEQNNWFFDRTADMFYLAKSDEIVKLLMYYIEHDEKLRKAVEKLIKQCNRQEYLSYSPLPVLAYFLPTISNALINSIMFNHYHTKPAMFTGFIGMGCALAFAETLYIGRNEIESNRRDIINSIDDKKGSKVSKAGELILKDRLEELLSDAKYRYTLQVYINRVNGRIKQRKKENKGKDVQDKEEKEDYSYEK